MNTQELINSWIHFNQEQKDILSLAIAKRGKFKGYLLANKPKDKRAAVVWNQFMMNIAPARASLWPIMLSDDPGFMEEVDSLIGPMFKYAVNATERPLRWNLWAHRYDGEKFMQNLIESGDWIDGNVLQQTG
jgi:gamma-glutamylcyclotransferase (GGCT)/AIG2-like uncharacterized protein YtfP